MSGDHGAGTLSAQPIWDDAWAAWVVRDPERPDAWLIWSDDSSSWQPLPVPQEPAAAPDARPASSPGEPEPLPAPVAARLHANGPLRADPPVEDAPQSAPQEIAPGPRRSTYEAPSADDRIVHDAQPQPQPVVRPVPQVGVPAPAVAGPSGAAPHPAAAPVAGPAPLHPGPFVAPSASQLIAVPAPRAAGGGTAVLALGIASVGIGAIVMLLGLASSSLLAVGIGDAGAVRVGVNLLALLAFPIALLGVVLGALQLRGGSAVHRDRALVGFGVCGTVTLLLVARAVTALANTLLHGYPLL